MEKSFSLTFANGSVAQALQIETETDITKVLEKLDLQQQRPVIVVIGGANLMSDEDLVRVKTLFAEIIAPLTQELGAYVVDGGTNAGIMRLMGEARAGIKATFALIGVCPIDLVNLPHQTNPLAEIALEPHHTHFMLVPGSNWGDESPWLAQIASYLSGNLPSVTVLINGGAISLVDAQENVARNRPLVVIAGTGRLADDIAKVVRQQATEVPQALSAVIAKAELTLFDLTEPMTQLEQLLREKLRG